MKWGFFTLTHILTLILAAAMLIGLYYLLRHRSQKVQTLVLGCLSFLGIAAIIFDLLAWGQPLNFLPLHLCSINAMVLPIAVFSRNKVLCNMLLVWCLGALAALILNFDMIESELFCWDFFFYYFPHVVEFGIPILIFALGLVKKDPKCIGSTIALSMGVYTIVHFLNLAVNSWSAANNFSYDGANVVSVNYMFSIAPNNPLVDFFYSIIPVRYWYMYLVLPIVFVYLLIVYAPELIRHFKKKSVSV